MNFCLQTLKQNLHPLVPPGSLLANDSSQEGQEEIEHDNAISALNLHSMVLVVNPEMLAYPNIKMLMFVGN